MTGTGERPDRGAPTAAQRPRSADTGVPEGSRGPEEAGAVTVETGAPSIEALANRGGAGEADAVHGQAPGPDDRRRASPLAWVKAGARVGHYEIIAPLAQGGMGAVFTARDTHLGRKVAIKFLLLESEQLREQFLFEARVTARFQSEHIVVIHEVGIHRDVPFMVLEHLDGHALSAEIKGETVPWRRAVELMIPVARALRVAHDAGIMHRDLKPANIFLTESGVVKVLDFGIAKETEQAVIAASGDPAEAIVPGVSSHQTLSAGGRLVGTLPFMSPEQWRIEGIDHQSDLWAFGIILYRMLVGRHPLTPVTNARLAKNLARLDEPFPSVAEQARELPPALVRIVDTCLQKRKGDRYATAERLLADLEALLPRQVGSLARSDACPYPGLAAFQETDAHLFCGREAELARMERFLSKHAVVGVVGPSGVGKSSFVRAGILPRLRHTDTAFDAAVFRPGQHPLHALVRAIERIAHTAISDPSSLLSHLLPEGGEGPEGLDEVQLSALLREHPGEAGVILRTEARRSGNDLLLFVDQFEEVFTLCHDDAERDAFLDCLLGAADDPSSPVRVIVSMRADYLDRVTVHPRFVKELSSGLFFLGLPGRQALEVALTQPAELAGYRFEDAKMVEEILEAAGATPGALPLLQSVAVQLWDRRDRKSRTFTRASYEALGGFAGALAHHADAFVSALGPDDRRAVRSIFLRLVTTEGTRAVADLDDLQGLSAPGETVERLLGKLVEARLLTLEVQDAGETTVEIVHEALIMAWPTLGRWVEQGREFAVLLEELREAARQWERKGRPRGLLWRGEAAGEARRFQKSYQGELSGREAAFLGAVLGAQNRGRRQRRRVVVGGFVLLAGLLVAAAIALITIQRAEGRARTEAKIAEAEATRAREAERQIKVQLRLIEEKEAARKKAEAEAATAATDLDMSRQELEKAYRKVEKALAHSRKATEKAEASRRDEVAARKEVQRHLKRERARVKALERERKKIVTELK